MTMPIINLQMRSRELGRIRLGKKGDRGQPQKLDKFRFTSNSRPLLEKIATLYGGEVRDWVNGTQRYELLSEADRLPIMVPPQPVTQWHEVWRKSGVAHRCDGERNAITDELCDPEDPLHIEAIAKPTTRLNVVLRDVEGVGVWRTESKGWHAAVELPDVALFLAQAGGYVNGWLSLEQRTSIDNSGDKPVTRHFMVPIIEIDVTPAQLMAGHGRVAAPALAGGPVREAPALAAAGPDYVALAADITDPAAITDLWTQAEAAGHMTKGLNDHLHKRHAELSESAPVTQPAPNEPQPDAEGIYEAEVVEDRAASPAEGPDPDVVWQQILKAGGERGMTLPDVEDDVKTYLNISSAEASGEELGMYLAELQARPVEAGAA